MIYLRFIYEYSACLNKRRGVAVRADSPEPTPVAVKHNAPKAPRPPARRADVARLTPVGGGTPNAY